MRSIGENGRLRKSVEVVCYDAPMKAEVKDIAPDSAISSDSLTERRSGEKATLIQMVGIYCAGQHHNEVAPVVINGYEARLCPSCRELVEYAFDRIDRCPHMETKTFCSACKTHCYQPQMRERIRQAMAYAGPRMLFVDPKGAIRHLLSRFER